GYDNDDAAVLYSTQVCSWDYAPLYWLADSFRSGASSVFDLGGHIGIKYYAFRRVLDYPDTLRWTVCDVPAVVRKGEQFARERQVDRQLAFCTDFAQAGDIDVLLMSGSLQYLPVRMEEILSMLPRKPGRVILNITAGHGDRTLYTLNSIVHAICPYRIQQQDEVLSEIRLCGYRRRDVWRNDGKPITIPFVEGGDGAFYFGCCFDRQATSSNEGIGH
ncbi:MAG: methyltransferase, TIGR04325 family, partial [Comamonadaceae bacterium]